MAPVAIEAEELQLDGTNGGPPRDIDPGGHGGDGDGRDPDPRYVPGAGLFAMRFALVSITVLFITIGIAYFARSRSPLNWQPIRVPNLLWLSTAIILISGWTLETARNALYRKNRVRFIRWIEITACAGLAFLLSQILALRELVDQGIFLQRNPHSSLLYVVTGAHGLHLLGGIAGLCFLLLSRYDSARLRARTAVSALYWHFLSVLWVGLFLGLLLWP
jgi:cytochrome c oxidase subunit 3